MKTNLTRQAEKCLWYEINRMGVFGCFEVTIGWLGNERVDYIIAYTDKEHKNEYAKHLSRNA